MLSLSECLKYTRVNALGLVAFGVFTASHGAQTKEGCTRRGSWLHFDVTIISALTAERVSHVLQSSLRFTWGSFLPTQRLKWVLLEKRVDFMT